MRYEVVQAVVSIFEVNDCFLQSARLFVAKRTLGYEA
jgi:hypothetical protein